MIVITESDNSLYKTRKMLIIRYLDVKNSIANQFQIQNELQLLSIFDILLLIDWKYGRKRQET